MNVGSDKYHPSGSSYTYIKFSEVGGILGHIITSVIKYFDYLKLYDNERENGILPAMLVDGHGSHFDLGVLRYICDENHKWAVIFVVYYGTSLWQLRDSA